MSSPYTKEIAAYFTSLDWAAKRAARLRKDNWRCRFCSQPTGDRQNPLQVHHMPGSYSRIPNESVEDDLITICKECHTALHKDLDRRRKQWNKNKTRPTAPKTQSTNTGRKPRK